VNHLQQAGLLEHVTVVAPRRDSDVESNDAAEATAIAASAASIAESYARQKGKDALVILDTLDGHKILFDVSTRVLVNLFGTDAVVKQDREGGASSEMRALFSTIIQRAQRFNHKNGGGSVTLILMSTIPPVQIDEDEIVYQESDFALYGEDYKERLRLLVEKNIPLKAETLRRIGIPIPSASEGKRRLALQHVDDLISMSDGHIWLDDLLKSRGQRPPLSVQKSLPRVGIGKGIEECRADAPALQKLVEGLRLNLAQAEDLAGSEASERNRQLRRRNAWLLAMYQKEGEGGRSLAESCVVLLAASMRALDATIDAGGLAGTEIGQKVVTDLLNHVQEQTPGAMEFINETLDMTPEVRKQLEESINVFFS